jgi:hypothetical protein
MRTKANPDRLYKASFKASSVFGDTALLRRGRSSCSYPDFYIIYLPSMVAGSISDEDIEFFQFI